MDSDDMAGDVDDGMSVGFLGSLQPSAKDRVSLMMLEQLGSYPQKSHLREKNTARRKILSEVYSPPRITAETTRAGWKNVAAGFAIDFTVVDPEDGRPWDFNRKDKRDKALAMVQKQEPYMLVGSPMCTAFCTWMALNRARSKDRQALEKAYRQAVRHMEFVSMLYREQASIGRYFLHEHPAGASSWDLDCIRDLW